MNVRIGIAEVGREVEVEVDDRDTFVSTIEKAYTNDQHILWFNDTKGNEVGIPLSKIAFVELLDSNGPSVGFSR